jgi:iron complex outermembrane receptor protein
MKWNRPNRGLTRNALGGIPMSLVAAGLVGWAAALTGQDNGAGEVFELSAFEVRAQEDYGYRATNTMTATRIGVALTQVPLSIQVVTEEFVEDLGMSSFSDSLRYVSSTVGDSLSPAGDSGNSYIRGFQTAWTLRNGFRRFRAIPMENVDRVEIVKGPVSVFFGQAAPGGITNIITKRPEFFDYGSVKATYGSYEYRKGSFEYNKVLVDDVLAARLYTSYTDSEDWKDFEYKEAYYIAPSLKWRPTRTTEIMIEYENMWSEENKAGSAIYGNQLALDNYADPDPALLTRYGNRLDLLQRVWRSVNVLQWERDMAAVGLDIPSDAARYMPELSPSGWRWNGNGPGSFVEYRSEDWTAELKQRVGDWFELRAGANYAESSSIDLRFHSADRPYPDGAIDLVRGNAGGLQENQTLTLQGDGLFRFNLKGTRHSILVGYERVEDDFQSANNNFDYTLAEGLITPTPDPAGTDRDLRQMFMRYYPFFDPVQPGAGMVFDGVASSLNRDESATRNGYYANYQGEYFEGRLNTMLGVRREEFEISGAGTVAVEYEDTVYMGGLTFELVKGLNVFASYSQSFEPNRPPNNVTVRGPGVEDGEAGLLPPKSGEGMDIGFKSALWDNKLAGTLTFFNLRQEASVATDTVRTENDPRNLDADPGNDVTWYRTAGKFESEGIELEIIYSPTPNYQLLAAASWMWDAGLVSDPNLPDDHGLFDRRNQNSPEYKFTIWNKYVFSEGRFEGLELGLGARYIDDHFPRSGLGTTQLLVNEDSLVFDGLIAYNTQLGGHDTRFSLQLENITDEVYQEGHTAAGDPFKVNFSMEVKF